MTLTHDHTINTIKKPTVTYRQMIDIVTITEINTNTVTHTHLDHIDNIHTTTTLNMMITVELQLTTDPCLLIHTITPTDTPTTFLQWKTET